MKYYIVATLIAFLFSCNSGPHIDTVNSPLSFNLSGKGTRTIVFIHGWCINQSYWSNQVSYFEKDYRVLTLDLAGHGNSKLQRTEWTIKSYASDIVDLLTQLNADSIILAAHSMAGNIALHIYDKMPDKVIGFIGIDNLQELGVERTDEEMKQANAYFEQMKNDFPNKSEEYASGNLFSATTPDSVKKKVLFDFRNANPSMAVSTLQSLMQEGKAEKLLAPKLKIPMLLILSDNNKKPLVDSSSLNKYCGSGYRIFTIPGTGHYPMIESPADFNNHFNNALIVISSLYGKNNLPAWFMSTQQKSGRFKHQRVLDQISLKG